MRNWAVHTSNGAWGTGAADTSYILDGVYTGVSLSLPFIQLFLSLYNHLKQIFSSSLADGDAGNLLCLEFDPGFGLVEELLVLFDSDETPVQSEGGFAGCSRSHEAVEH